MTSKALGLDVKVPATTTSNSVPPMKLLNKVPSAETASTDPVFRGVVVPKKVMNEARQLLEIIPETNRISFLDFGLAPLFKARPDITPLMMGEIHKLLKNSPNGARLFRMENEVVPIFEKKSDVDLEFLQHLNSLFSFARGLDGEKYVRRFVTGSIVENPQIDSRTLSAVKKALKKVEHKDWQYFLKYHVFGVLYNLPKEKFASFEGILEESARNVQAGASVLPECRLHGVTGNREGTCVNTDGYFQEAISAGIVVRTSALIDRKRCTVYVKGIFGEIDTGNIVAYCPKKNRFYEISLQDGKVVVEEESQHLPSVNLITLSRMVEDAIQFV